MSNPIHLELAYHLYSSFEIHLKKLKRMMNIDKININKLKIIQINTKEITKEKKVEKCVISSVQPKALYIGKNHGYISNFIYNMQLNQLITIY